MAPLIERPVYRPRSEKVDHSFQVIGPSRHFDDSQTIGVVERGRGRVGNRDFIMHDLAKIVSCSVNKTRERARLAPPMEDPIYLEPGMRRMLLEAPQAFLYQPSLPGMKRVLVGISN